MSYHSPGPSLNVLYLNLQLNFLDMKEQTRRTLLREAQNLVKRKVADSNNSATPATHASITNLKPGVKLMTLHSGEVPHSLFFGQYLYCRVWYSAILNR